MGEGVPAPGWLWKPGVRAGLRVVGKAVSGVRAPLTFAGLVSGDVLSPQPLVQDIKHLPAQVQEEQGQRAHRHDAGSEKRGRRSRGVGR